MSTQPSQLMSRTENPDGKEALQVAFTEAEAFREAAVKYLKKKWNKIDKDRTSVLNYELPAYSEKQADCNGSLRTIEEIMKEVFNVEGSK